MKTCLYEHSDFKTETVELTVLRTLSENATSFGYYITVLDRAP